MSKVSIVIPTKDRYKLLMETLDSVRAQTYPDWEAIVVDDGSFDGTIEMLTALSQEEPRIRLLPRIGSRSGGNVCRNQGISASKGDYLIFLDSDDLLAPFCLANRVEVMDADPLLDFAVFHLEMFRETPGDTGLLWNAFTSKNDLDRFLNVDGVWQTMCPVWRRHALDAVGPWDENALSMQDWDYSLRALIQGLNYKKFECADCFYRMIHGRSTVTLYHRSIDHLQSQERLVYKLHGLLSQNGQLDCRKMWVAGLYYWTVNNWLAVGRRADALRVWKTCFEQQLVSQTMYYEGVCYIAIRNIRIVRGVLRRYIALRWPTEMFCNQRLTFQNVPSSVLAPQIVCR